MAVRRELSQGERERRRELARQLHEREVVDADGNKRRAFGGAQPGSGRPRKERALKRAADAAKDNAEDIIDALKSGISKESPIQVRVNSATRWLEIEAKEESLELEEEKMLEGLRRDQLIEMLAGKLGVLLEAGALPIVEGTALGELERGDT